MNTKSNMKEVLELDLNSLDMEKVLDEMEKLNLDDEEDIHVTERGTYWKYVHFTKKELKKIVKDKKSSWDIYNEIFEDSDQDEEVDNYFINSEI